MTELFVAGGMLFYVVILVELVVLFSTVEYKNGAGATISLVVFGTILQYFFNINILKYIWDNPFKIIAFVVCYFLIGTAWGVIKWVLLNWSCINEAKEFRAELLRQYKVKDTSELDAENLVVFQRELKRNCVRPTIHAKDFLRWAAYWWISLTAFLFADLAKMICKQIYYSIAGWLQRISINMWKRAGFDID